MSGKSEYALLWANGASFGEIYDLMRVDILDSERGASTFRVGERVAYDENEGKVVELERDRYRVEWDDGVISVEWGSDLVRIA